MERETLMNELIPLSGTETDKMAKLRVKKPIEIRDSLPSPRQKSKLLSQKQDGGGRMEEGGRGLVFRHPPSAFYYFINIVLKSEFSFKK
jgi:hypothetical protein